jgi:hypothetical protein
MFLCHSAGWRRRTSASGRKLLCKLFENATSVSMGISKQHSRVPVPTDGSHFWNRQTHLEKSADGFMSQIMEMQILDPCPLEHPVPCQLREFAVVGNTLASSLDSDCKVKAASCVIGIVRE